jgi:UDP-N-acetyl-2-amino-2-deoxyglucuronate dehydrogenase
MAVFNIAVVGCGVVSGMHFAGYLAHPERVRVVAACDIDRARVEAAQQKYGFAYACDSIEQLIERGGWDVAVVCTPTPIRKQAIDKLAAAGKHIFVEKPLADTLDAAQELVAICERHQVQLAVDQNFRYHYPFDTARRLIAEGRIGDVISIYHQDLSFRQDAGWRLGAQRHALSVMGVHWLDGFRWMLDDDARSLTCATRSSPAIDCVGETDACVQIVFERGAIVSYVQSFASPVSRAETLVLGERGALALGYEGIALFDNGHGAEPRERWANPFAGKNKPESAFMGLDSLLTAIEQRAEPPNSGRDNLKTIALLDGAYRSAQERSYEC